MSMDTVMAPAGAPASRHQEVGKRDVSVMSDERALRVGVEDVLDAATGRPPRNVDDAMSIMTSTHAAIRRIAADQRVPLTAVRGRLRQAADFLRAETAAASTAETMGASTVSVPADVNRRL